MIGEATRSIFFGWKVVVTAFTVATFTFGFGYYGPAVFLTILHQQRGWSVAVISWAVTAHFLTSALLVAHLPDVHRRFGIAAVTQVGVAALVGGMFCWSLATSLWFLFMAAVLSGAGWAATSAAAIIAMVSPWFERRRGLALGHALNGASVGGVLFAPLWVTLIAAIGFAPAVAAVGLVTLTVLWPLIGRYLRPTPHSLGLAADGDPPRVVRPVAAPSAHRPARFITLLANWKCVTLSIAFALGMFAQVGVVAHLITRLLPLVRVVAAGNFTMQACGVMLLAFGSTAPVLVPGCILFGLGIGSLLSLPPLIAQKEFSALDVPRVVALVTAVNQAVFAFAPAILGVLREISGTYTIPFLLAACVQVLAGAIIVLGRDRSTIGELV
jgi:MFS family permease